MSSEEGLINGKVYPFPHCDSNILHAPGKCSYCDTYPARQGDRQRLGINFTMEHDAAKTPCPSSAYRDDEGLSWHGNVPMDPEMRAAEEAYWQEFDRDMQSRTPARRPGEWFFGDTVAIPGDDRILPRDPLWVRAVVFGMEQFVKRCPKWLK